MRFKAIVLTLALVASVPWVRPAQGTSARELRRINVISTTDSGMVRVHVPRTARWDATSLNQPGGDIRIEGRGRYVGLIITEDSNKRWPELVGSASHYGGCRSRGCAPTDDALDDTDGGGMLSPGKYRFYVVADGAPVKIVLKLDGLSGRTALRLNEPIEANIFSPKPVFHDNINTYFSSGVTSLQEGDRYYESLLWVRTTALGGVYEWCAHESKRVGSKEQSFTPAYCAEHDNQASDPLPFVPDGARSIRYYHLQGDPGLFRGPFSAGHWVKMNAPIERAGSTHVFITY